MEVNTEKKRGKLIYKVLTIIILLGLLIAVSCGIIGFIQFTNVIQSMYSTETSQIGNTVVDFLDVNNIDTILSMLNSAQTEDQRNRITRETIHSERYSDLIRFLDDLRRNINVIDVYIADFRGADGKISETGIYFAGVAGTRVDPDISAIGERVTVDENMLAVIEKIYDTGISPEEHLRVETDLGPVMNAFIPISDKYGQVIGIVSVQEPMSKLYSARNEYLLTVSFYSLILTALFTVLFIYLNRKLIIKPIEKITRATSSFVENNNSFSEDLKEVRTNDEIETLALSFAQMEEDLNNYIDNLQKVTSEKERVQTELNVATDIQKNMLPTIFPPFPEKSEFDIFATMEPAKEVGGDFYDMFLIDDDHLAFGIADVSGKGVPAALFMVIAKTLIKDHTTLGESPSEIFTNVNNLLCESNGNDMFVTAWLGILELSTGKLTYVNAGHNAPAIKRANGEFEYLKQRPGLVLAGLEGIPYRQAELTLEKGDKIYLYTDGVTEAQDKENTLYGDDRLLKILNQNSEASVYDLLPIIRKDIQSFVKDADQFDDITMLILEMKESSKEQENSNED